jgi:hypothetical protein
MVSDGVWAMQHGRAAPGMNGSRIMQCSRRRLTRGCIGSIGSHVLDLAPPIRYHHQRISSSTAQVGSRSVSRERRDSEAWTVGAGYGSHAGSCTRFALPMFPCPTVAALVPWAVLLGAPFACLCCLACCRWLRICQLSEHLCMHRTSRGGVDHWVAQLPPVILSHKVEERVKRSC